MRISGPAAVLLLLLLAGCALPGAEEAEDEPDPLFGLCPQWTQGPGGQTSGFHLGGNQTEHPVELGPANEEHEGLPLDLYRITLTNLSVQGRLELRAFDADGRQAGIRDYRLSAPQISPVAVFTDDGAEGDEVEVYLDPVTGEGSSFRAPVRLQWTIDDGSDAMVTFDVTYHYKVCGAGDL